MAVSGHQLIHLGLGRLIGHLLRGAGHQSVWSPAWKDQVAGGHAGVGVVSLGGALLALPSSEPLSFRSSFGWVGL